MKTADIWDVIQGDSSDGWRAYRAAILLAVIGRSFAIGNVFGTRLSGFAVWLVGAFMHLTYLVTFQSRLLVFYAMGVARYR